MSIRGISRLACALSLLCGGAAFAQGACQPGAGDARPAVAFIWENDALVGPDRDYSNGVGLVYSVPRESCAVLGGAAKALGPVFDRRLFHGLPGLEARAGRRIEHLTTGLGHQIYTPDDLTRADPDPADRPYAAWLYYSVAFIQETRGAEPVYGLAPALSALSITQLDLGMVGPSAQGEWLQRGFHDIINAKVDPAGWSHQIGDEPGLIVRHERLVASRWERGSLDLELSLNAGLALGNVMTDASTGIGFRLGYNIGVDYGPPRLRPGLASPNVFERGLDGPFSAYVLGGVGGRAVARNIFLDGNTFAASPSVDRRTFVLDYQLGAAMVYGPVKIAGTRVWRSEEFAGQGRDSAFDSLTLGFRF